jgi:hypothetical protein
MLLGLGPPLNVTVARLYLATVKSYPVYHLSKESQGVWTG